MKRTSRSSRLVRRAARSPALPMTGPEVARKPTPSSRAMIWASVVLPRPGGPANSTWSSGVAASLGRLDEHLEVGARLLLADELAQILRAQRWLRVVSLALGPRDEARGVADHGLFCARIRAGRQECWVSCRTDATQHRGPLAERVGCVERQATRRNASRTRRAREAVGRRVRLTHSTIEPFGSGYSLPSERKRTRDWAPCLRRPRSSRGGCTG